MVSEASAALGAGVGGRDADGGAVGAVGGQLLGPRRAQAGGVAARRAGHDIGRGQVARLMKLLGIGGVRRSKKVRATRADPKAGRPADLVERIFAAEGPNRLWVADLT